MNKNDYYKVKIEDWLAKKKEIPQIIYGTEVRDSGKAKLLKVFPKLRPASHCQKCGKKLKNKLDKELGFDLYCLEDISGIPKERYFTEDEDFYKKMQKWLYKKKSQTVWLPKSNIEIEKAKTKEVLSYTFDMSKIKSIVNTENKLIIKFDLENNEILFDFNYSETIKQKIKLLGEARFDNKNNIWKAPLLPYIIKKINFLFPEKPDPENKKLKNNSYNRVHYEGDIKKAYQYASKTLSLSSKEKSDFKVEGLTFDLYPYQKAGVELIDKRFNGKALLADEMGLGKTVQTIAYTEIYKNKRPVLIVPPASLKINWKKEFDKWLKNPEKVHVMNGQSNTELPKADIYICNYDILPHRKDQLKKIDFKIMAIDEAQAIKNSKTDRAKAVHELKKGIDKRIAITGTPMLNRPKELFSILNFLRPDLYDNFFWFGNKFCDGKKGAYGWDFTGVSNSKLLHQKLLNEVMIRRKKENVLKDLPKKRKEIVYFDIANRKEYQKAEKDFINWLYEISPEKAKKAQYNETLVKISYLRQLVIEGKLKSIYQWIDTAIENDVKLILFAHHRKIIKTIEKKYKNIAVRVMGGDSAKKKNKAVEFFQNDENTRLFLGNIKAAGVGLTLTESNNVCFIELGWTPGDLKQAEDRSHRIGQDLPVTAWYLLAENTIDERIYNLIQEKQAVFDKIIDGKSKDEEVIKSQFKKQLVSDLIDKYNKRKIA